MKHKLIILFTVLNSLFVIHYCNAQKIDTVYTMDMYGNPTEPIIGDSSIIDSLVNEISNIEFSKWMDSLISKNNSVDYSALGYDTSEIKIIWFPRLDTIYKMEHQVRYGEDKSVLPDCMFYIMKNDTAHFFYYDMVSAFYYNKKDEEIGNGMSFNSVPRFYWHAVELTAPRMMISEIYLVDWNGNHIHLTRSYSGYFNVRLMKKDRRKYQRD